MKTHHRSLTAVARGAATRSGLRALAVTAVLLVFATAVSSANGRVSNLYIVADRDTVLAGSDIGAYDPATGELVLTAEGASRWSKWEQSLVVDGRKMPQLSTLTGRPFRLEISGALIAEGHFSSVLSSTAYRGLVLYDSLIRPGDSRLRFVYGEVPDSTQSADPSKSETLLGYFRASGKLVEQER